MSPSGKSEREKACFSKNWRAESTLEFGTIFKGRQECPPHLGFEQGNSQSFAGVCMEVRARDISRRHLLSAAVALCAAGGSLVRAAEKRRTFAEALFAKPRLVDIRLKAADADLASLHKEPRGWVEASAQINGEALARVGIHLKGTTSFMPLDKKPSLTLSIDKYAAGRRWMGLHKFHLNNSVQDASFLCEDLAGELFHRAGVPRARSAWAMVRLNERDLGLYVLKEAFTSDFLTMHFGNTHGNFYDGGLHHDIFQPLRLDSGSGPRDCADLKALYAACQMADPAARLNAMEKLLDMERFVSMMAMECLTCHIDGYSMMQNNFRIYFDPGIGKAVFIVHGMDRMFSPPEAPLEPKLHAVLSKGIMSAPEGKRRYLARLGELVSKVFVEDWMTARIDAATALLEPAYPPITDGACTLRDRVIQRVAFAKGGVAELAVKA